MTELLDSLAPLPVGHASMLAPATDRDHLHTVYKQGRWYEQDLLEAIQKLQRGGVFVDVGAGYGNHTIFFATECAAERVITIEPYPGNFEILEANIRHNDLGDVVIAHNALIHPEWKSATMSAAEGEELPETWCYSAQPILTEHGDTFCSRLDDLLAGVNVDVMKIDVEELSPAVLETSLATVAHSRPLIAIEAEPSEQEAIASMLTSLDYDCIGCYCATPTFLWQAS